MIGNSAPFLYYRKLRCNVVVIDKNCEAILARAPALAVPFFIISYFVGSGRVQAGK